MTVTYATTGTLTNPVTDLTAAREYLHEPMENFVQYAGDTPFGTPSPLTEIVHTCRWDLLDEQRWVVRVVTTRPLTDAESATLSRWISGQNSDGLGEGFEQQPFAEHFDTDEWGDIDDDTYEMSSFDWETNPCTLMIVRATVTA